ncbi:hypothetical protein CY34DRAFT_803408, partial [Suillus luteus UH-Slu-Lm8-n1]
MGPVQISPVESDTYCTQKTRTGKWISSASGPSTHASPKLLRRMRPTCGSNKKFCQ